MHQYVDVVSYESIDCLIQRLLIFPILMHRASTGLGSSADDEMLRSTHTARYGEKKPDQTALT